MALPPSEAFRHCPSCGAARDPAKVGENPYLCEACGFTLYFSPIVAVATLILDAAGELLVIRRARDPGKGKLGMPGGFVDRGEGVGDAARREIREEVGLEFADADLEYVGSWPNTYHYKGLALPVSDVFFLARVDDFDGVELDRSEVLHFEVLPLDQLDPDDFAFASNANAALALRQRLTADRA